jgi:phosphatidylglycerol:prolipoprotein diacylglycerol transferase
MEVSYYVHDLNPIIFELGWGLKVSWYGLMYVIGFVIGMYLLRYLRKTGFLPLKTDDDVADLVTYAMLGVIIGGRLGHVLFYTPGQYFADPLSIFKVWEGGMASHGGFIAVLLFVRYFAKKRGVELMRILDAIVIAAALGLGFGRFGNFINAEMVGKVTDVPWAVIFPMVDELPRHPVQIYQALTEGPLLFLILWFMPRNKYAAGTHGSVFLVAYGIFRSITEYYREIDVDQLGLYFGIITKGQILSFIMIAAGILLFWYLNKKKDPGEAKAVS